MPEKLKVFNPHRAKGDLVIFKNPAAHPFVDSTPGGVRFELKAGQSLVIPKSLAIWFIGNYESPFWKQGPGTEAEIAAIYSRNRYQEIFCRVVGEAAEDSKPDIDNKTEKPYEDVEEPQELLNEMAKNPKKLVIDMSHLDRKPTDPERGGGPNFV